MTLDDHKIDIVAGVNDVPTTPVDEKHPNESLLCDQYNNLIDELESYDIPNIAAPTVAVGATNTLSPGSNANVINIGDSYNAVFSFGIPTGEAGPQGIQGDPGSTGPAGNDGTAATIAVGITSTLPPGSNANVMNSGTANAAVFDFGIPQGDTGPAGADGAQGPQGDPGPAGSDGAAATIAVGVTSTLPAGSNANVVNSGTSSAAVFEFAIPRGDDGAQGPQGLQGDTGPAGSNGSDGAAATVAVGTTTTLPPGSNANVINTGTSSAAVFAFSIPQGVDGAQGIQGETGPQGLQGDPGSDGADGLAATVAIGITSTLPPGSNANVINTGTSSAAVFEFGIPRGADGADGADGATGPQGPKGDPGADGADGADGPPPPVVVLTQAAYDALTPVAGTFYVING